jgi:hypothetical protein
MKFNIDKPEFRPVTFTVETEEELKDLWCSTGVASCVAQRVSNSFNVGEIDSDKHNEIWKVVDRACIDLGLKCEYGNFKE